MKELSLRRSEAADAEVVASQPDDKGTPRELAMRSTSGGGQRSLKTIARHVGVRALRGNAG